MPKAINTQSQKRHEESLASLFTQSVLDDGKHVLILKSSSDEGVIRNGGRNGARFAPGSLMATLKRMTITKNIEKLRFIETEISDGELEKSSFTEAQKKETQKITAAIGKLTKNPVIHIGGGHDHIYPLLSAFGSTYKKIVVINIDAHADTRTDDEPNSGTPFRQFANEYSGEFKLVQVGLHPFANSTSTLSPLSKGDELILWKNEIEAKQKEFFKNLAPLIDHNTAVVFSLDADAICASQVPGVSAVNADGLSLETLNRLWKSYRELSGHHPAIVGIYELNPVYDTLASLSMRSIAAFIFGTLDLRE